MTRAAAFLEGGRHLGGSGAASRLAEDEQYRRADAHTDRGGDDGVNREKAADDHFSHRGDAGKPPQSPPPAPRQLRSSDGDDGRRSCQPRDRRQGDRHDPVPSCQQLVPSRGVGVP